VDELLARLALNLTITRSELTITVLSQNTSEPLA
jgi:hypothetical protein